MNLRSRSLDPRSLIGRAPVTVGSSITGTMRDDKILEGVTENPGSRRAKHPLYPGPFREPGLIAQRPGKRAFSGGPLGNIGKVPNRVCDR